MISYLKGNIILKGRDFAILNVNGVGYKVFVGERESGKMAQGQEAEFFCSLRMKQDQTIELYGFSSAAALQFFETVNSISGIGPKTALLLSSLGTIDELTKAIRQGDAKIFQGVKGIGEKKIVKIMAELAGKFGPFSKKENAPADDALDALVALGFSKASAKQALENVPEEIQNTEQRIKQALAILGKS